jgi:hypothetical protein
MRQISVRGCRAATTSLLIVECELICGVIVHSSADGSGNIVTDERWFGNAIDQLADGMLANPNAACRRSSVAGDGRVVRKRSNLEISLDILREAFRQKMRVRPNNQPTAIALFVNFRAALEGA